jgi:hypothetical protein
MKELLVKEQPGKTYVAGIDVSDCGIDRDYVTVCVVSVDEKGKEIIEIVDQKIKNKKEKFHLQVLGFLRAHYKNLIYNIP